MFRKLADRITGALTAEAGKSEEEREAAVRMATAVLMAEVARADYDYDEREFELLMRLASHHFELSPEAAAELANEASESAEDNVSLHQFTQLLNRNLGEKEKEHVIALLWQIAFADGRLDKYEDSLVLQIGDLLYVNRTRVMRLKHDADPNAED